ncbi:hypothetical protein BgiBS90_013203, partial [Biomphalaria glabrata]
MFCKMVSANVVAAKKRHVNMRVRVVLGDQETVFFDVVSSFLFLRVVWTLKPRAMFPDTTRKKGS